MWQPLQFCDILDVRVEKSNTVPACRKRDLNYESCKATEQFVYIVYIVNDDKGFEGAY